MRNNKPRRPSMPAIVRDYADDWIDQERPASRLEVAGSVLGLIFAAGVAAWAIFGFFTGG